MPRLITVMMVNNYFIFFYLDKILSRLMIFLNLSTIFKIRLLPLYKQPRLVKQFFPN